MVNGNAKLFGLVSNPISQVKTPHIFNQIFNQKKINAVYTPFHIKDKSHLQCFFTSLRHIENFVGLNISIPYKSEVLKYIDYTDTEAMNIGAVNIIHKRDHKLYGYNTDGFGFVEGLITETSSNIKDTIILILGAGGASRAICYELIKHRPSKIIIANRSMEKAVKLIMDMKNYAETNTKLSAIPLENIYNTHTKYADFVINTSSVGMNNDKSLIHDVRFFNINTIFCDIIMSPVKTKLIKSAQAVNKKVYTGDNMLVYQIKKMCEIWNISNVDISFIKKIFK